MNLPLYRVTLVREPGAVDVEVAAVRKAEEAAQIFRPLFTGLDREQFAVMLLDVKHRPVALNVVSIGSLGTAIVHPREVFKPAILANSAALILAHNHPSGDPAPSSEDIETHGGSGNPVNSSGSGSSTASSLAGSRPSTRSWTRAVSKADVRQKGDQRHENSGAVGRCVEAHQHHCPGASLGGRESSPEEGAELVARKGGLAMAPA
jgi:DNA repair protein RadC